MELILWLVAYPFFDAIQTFFIGVNGDCIGTIYTQVRKMFLVIEQERINFD